MTEKQFKIVTKSTHFIYFVTEEDENKNWCLKVAIKDRYKGKFKRAAIDEISGYKVVLKMVLSLPNSPNYMRFATYEDSPYKFMDLDKIYRNEIKKKIKDTTTKYEGELIPYYDYAITIWEELNDKEKFFNYETPNQRLAWLTTPCQQKITGLAMAVELPIQTFEKNKDFNYPYIIVQNNREEWRADGLKSWVKMKLDGTVLENKKLIFEDYEMSELKYWIEMNKLPILSHWTQETDTFETIKMLKTMEIIQPNLRIEKKDWESKRIIWAAELEKYFDSLKDKLIGKTIDKIFYTGILFNKYFDDFYEYKNGEWYQEDKKCDEPGYYPWKESGTLLWLDSPVILDFEGTRLEIEYWSGSLVNVNTNSIDTKNYGADVSKHFSRNIIGQKLVDIQIHKTNEVYFMNFSHLGIDRKDGDDMFEEIWFVFENGYKLELTTDHTDYTIFSEISR